jgi:predicted DNA-binding protein YlxM (UPF0122 family)
MRKRELKKEMIEEEIKKCEEKIEDYGKNLGIRQTHDITSKIGAILQDQIANKRLETQED